LYDSVLKDYGSKTILIAIAALASISLPGTASAGTGCTAPTDGPPICLTGTILAPGATVAMIERAGSTSVEDLRQGDMILDWRLTEIGPKFIKLAQAEKIVTLDLSGTVAHAEAVPVTAAAEQAAAAAPNIKKGPMKRLQAWAARGEREPPK
jgi:hypothetical protein